jgi:hypothetical protein
VNSELERMWGGGASVMASLKVSSWHLCAGTEENHGQHSQDSRSSGRDLNPGPLKYEAGELTLYLDAYVIVIEQVSAKATQVTHFGGTRFEFLSGF